MQVNGGLEAIRMAVEYETKGKKCIIGVFAIVNWVIATCIGGAFLSYMINSNDIQGKWTDFCDANKDVAQLNAFGAANPCDVVWYDIGFITPFGLPYVDNGEVIWPATAWTDPTEAEKIQTDIGKDCGDDDIDCYT